jgi:hypothetical protein
VRSSSVQLEGSFSNRIIRGTLGVDRGETARCGALLRVRWSEPRPGRHPLKVTPARSGRPHGTGQYHPQNGADPPMCSATTVLTPRTWCRRQCREPGTRWDATHLICSSYFLFPLYPSFYMGISESNPQIESSSPIASQSYALVDEGSLLRPCFVPVPGRTDARHCRLQVASKGLDGAGFPLALGIAPLAPRSE